MLTILLKLNLNDITHYSGWVWSPKGCFKTFELEDNTFLQRKTFDSAIPFPFQITLPNFASIEGCTKISVICVNMQVWNIFQFFFLPSLQATLPLEISDIKTAKHS